MDKRGVTHGRRQAHLESHRLGSIKVGDLGRRNYLVVRALWL